MKVIQAICKFLSYSKAALYSSISIFFCIANFIGQASDRALNVCKTRG